MAGEVVRIRNLGPDTFKDSYDNIMFVIPPGQERIVQVEAMHLWMGDASLVDVDERRRFRTDEYARLCTLYGVYQDQHLFEPNRPKLEAFDLDGARLITLFEDPFGDEVTPDVRTKAQNVLLTERMATMERELKMLRAQSEIADRSQIAQDNSDAVGDRRPGPNLPPQPPIPPHPSAAPASSPTFPTPDRYTPPERFDPSPLGGEGPSDAQAEVDEDGPMRVSVRNGVTTVQS